MKLKLSDTPVGTLKPPMRWSNDQQKNLPIDARQTFLERFSDRKLDYKNRMTGEGKTMSQQLFYRVDSIGDGQAFHKNYMEYLQKAWGDHLSIVISPEVLWYSVLCELATMIKADPEKFRPIFSTTQEKQTLIVVTAAGEIMPLNELVDLLKQVVPSDSSRFFPEFTTSTPRSTWACNAAFADMCSPYYNYCMLMCGFPSINIRGEMEDWQNLIAHWEKMKDITPGKWHNQVLNVFKDVYANLDSPAFWKTMFRLDRCGSGSQVEVSGWLTNLFPTQPSVRYPENYSPHVSIVPYHHLSLKKDFEMRAGLFFSKQQDEFLVPDYGFIVHEKKEPIVLEAEKDDKWDDRLKGRFEEIILQIESETIVAK